uniref:Uncharacterized protein n=1 Tax=Siphoviridae sp. ctvok7 TaxID=2827596 RepID=A0A8S5LM37_9CAUD|nr:MAG TPA: hypothetical protein [Siphoviridae sp. ctvok7]
MQTDCWMILPQQKNTAAWVLLWRERLDGM